ncbi:GNAT family N-acetyltransferase [Chloroflexota bacterium]
MNSEVRLLNENEYSLWDNLVDESSQGTVFHKSFWLKASEKKIVIYGYFKGRELYAGIPLSHCVKFGIRVALPPLLTPYSGVLLRKSEGKYVTRLSAEKEATQKIAQKLKSDQHFVNFMYPPGVVNIQPFLWEGFSLSIMYTYIIQLDRSLEDIWNAMEFETRHHIRKAEKDGIVINKSDDFNQTLNLVEKSNTRQNRDVRSELMVCPAHDEVLAKRGQCKSFLAQDKNGDNIAAVYIVWDNRRSYNVLSGYDSEKKHHGASTLALWKAIEFSKQELGLEEFDFEGSMVPRLERFYRGFGGQQIVRYGVTWVKPSLKILVFAREAFRQILARLRLQNFS